MSLSNTRPSYSASHASPLSVEISPGIPGMRVCHSTSFAVMLSTPLPVAARRRQRSHRRRLGNPPVHYKLACRSVSTLQITPTSRIPHQPPNTSEPPSQRHADYHNLVGTHNFLFVQPGDDIDDVPLLPFLQCLPASPSHTKNRTGQSPRTRNNPHRPFLQSLHRPPSRDRMVTSPSAITSPVNAGGPPMKTTSINFKPSWRRRRRR